MKGRHAFSQVEIIDACGYKHAIVLRDIDKASTVWRSKWYKHYPVRGIVLTVLPSLPGVNIITDKTPTAGTSGKNILIKKINICWYIYNLFPE